MSKNPCNKPLWMLISVVVIVLLACKNERQQTVSNEQSTITEHDSRKEIEHKLRLKADSALLFCKEKSMNTDFCILTDVSLHSGNDRLFIWDFKGDSIFNSGLCAHGYGKGSTRSKPVFSNVEGSYCTSLGKYKTGARSYSQYGINVHYKLHGLEKTNHNAFKRIVVLHSYHEIPDHEIYPNHLPLGYSQGCPVVSNRLMTQLDSLLKKQKKPVLLWVYN